jgi:fumarylacetoacetase
LPKPQIPIWGLSGELAMTGIDHTHNPELRSWVASANGHADFPIQNLPFGVFTPPNEPPRGGVAIGDEIFDLVQAVRAGLFDEETEAVAVCAAAPSLNAFLQLGAGPRRALRARLSALLSEENATLGGRSGLLHRAADCVLGLPAQIGDYTDFYVGIHHARQVGKLFRPDNPLLPNYKYVPIAYHGRASSIVSSGTPVRRPFGQSKPADKEPKFAPTARLDYELELGVWIGTGNGPGDPIGIDRASEHIAGFCLLNDWSARDIQAWEYQPLGPFLAKNFATTISNWIVTPEALAPFRIPQPERPAGDPAPLPYLFNAEDQRCGGMAIELEVLLTTTKMREDGLPPYKLGLSNTRNMYWTVAQMVAHHTSNGCNLRAGDLMGSGTISGPANDQRGSLLEATEGGRDPIRLPTGEERTFLLDGDEILLRARAVKSGFASIGFGECRGVIVDAPTMPGNDVQWRNVR